MKAKHLLTILICLALAAAAAVAQQKVVVLKNGRRLTGEVTKTKAGYEIKTGTYTAILPTDQVLRVAEAVTPKQEFQQRKAKIAAGDVEAMYELASWARDSKMLIESRDLLKQVLKLKPGHENAALLLRLVEIALAKRPGPAPRPVPTTQGTTTQPGVDASRLLKMADVYRIRLVELKRNDRVAIEFRNKVLDRFIDANKGRDMFSNRQGERRFRMYTPVRQVMYMLDHTDRADASIRDDILIKSDPAVIKTFRSRVWPIVQRGCASASCHGGAKGAGKFRLFDMPMTDDRVAYTNFYILHAWRLDRRRMIYRDDPPASVLLQAGLPKKIAKPSLSHPTVLNPPVFTSERGRNYRQVEQWIRSLTTPLLPPGYRVIYQVPNLPRPSARPAPEAPN